MIRTAYLDASALCKRYATEPGTNLVNDLFARVPPERMVVLAVGAAEVVSVLVRRRNSRRLTRADYDLALDEFLREIFDPPQLIKVSSDQGTASAAFGLIDAHSINGTDALVLRSALDLASQYRAVGEDLFLVASDLRLLRAAQAEGLLTFDPERQSQPDLDALLGP